jgi:hypothetical protein
MSKRTKFSSFIVRNQQMPKIEQCKHSNVRTYFKINEPSIKGKDVRIASGRGGSGKEDRYLCGKVYRAT